MGAVCPHFFGAPMTKFILALMLILVCVSLAGCEAAKTLVDSCRDGLCR